MIELIEYRKEKEGSCNKSIVLFHHAGGSAFFYSPWRAHIDNDVDVYALQLKDRKQLLDICSQDGFNAIVAEIGNAIRQTIDHEIVMFGHSMGGLLAYATAAYLQEQGDSPLVKKLFVSGIVAPKRVEFRNFRSLSESQIFEFLTAYDGIPAEILANQDILDLILPNIVQDLFLIDEFCSVRNDLEPIKAPITALMGNDDPMVEESSARMWEKHTESEFKLMDFDGGHFYLKNMIPKICDILNEEF